MVSLPELLSLLVRSGLRGGFCLQLPPEPDVESSEVIVLLEVEGAWLGAQLLVAVLVGLLLEVLQFDDGF